MWTPVPPITPEDGESTVEVAGETVKTETEGVPAGTPIGMGFRVSCTWRPNLASRPGVAAVLSILVMFGLRPVFAVFEVRAEATRT
jgi:hypothetical protein